ncbi:MAG: CotH kinase family protein [Candidatus Sumerlaeia bacterium]
MKLHYREKMRQFIWRKRWWILIWTLILGGGILFIWRKMDTDLPLFLKIPREMVIAFSKDDSTIPTYQIAITPAQLRNFRREFHSRTGLVKHFANVDVRYRDDSGEIDWIGQARIRRRGIMADQLLAKNFKIEFENAEALGFIEAHLIPIRHKTSSWLIFHGWLAEELGLISPRMRFVRVQFNGVDWGLYVEVEQFGREMLKRYGLGNSDLYGETDDFGNVTNTILYDTTARWKKYDPLMGNEKDFTPMREFLELINEGDDAEFRREIFGLVDKENVMRWHAHQEIMNSYHQTSFGNNRLLYNRVTGKLEFVPWDALPGNFSLDNRPYLTQYVTNLLIMRLKNHPEYMADYSKYLHQAVSELRPRLPGIFDTLYMTEDILKVIQVDPLRHHVADREHFQRGDLSTFQKYWQYIWHLGWPSQVRWMSRYIDTSCSRLLWGLENARCDVLAGLDASPRRSYSLRLNYGAQSVSRLERLDIPLTVDSELAEGASVSLSLRLEARPKSGNFDFPLHPAEKEPEPYRVERRLAVRNGYLVAEDLDFLLMPGFPRVQMQMPFWKRDFEAMMNAVELQRYALSIESDRPLAIAGRKIRVQVRNLADGTILDAEYLYYDIGQSTMREQISIGPDELARQYDWMQYDPAKKALRVDRGEVDILRDLVIPRSTRLLVEAGTRLRLAPGVSVFSWSPVEMLGNPKNGVYLEPLHADKQWGVLAVVDCPTTSVLRHVQFRGAGSASALEVDFTGALNFHEAPHILENCRIMEPGNTAISVWKKEEQVYRHE